VRTQIQTQAKIPILGSGIFIFGYKMGLKRDSPGNVLFEWLRKRSMKVKLFF